MPCFIDCECFFRIFYPSWERVLWNIVLFDIPSSNHLGISLILLLCTFASSDSSLSRAGCVKTASMFVKADANASNIFIKQGYWVFDRFSNVWWSRIFHLRCFVNAFHQTFECWRESIYFIFQNGGSSFFLFNWYSLLAEQPVTLVVMNELMDSDDEKPQRIFVCKISKRKVYGLFCKWRCSWMAMEVLLVLFYVK